MLKSPSQPRLTTLFTLPYIFPDLRRKKSLVIQPITRRSPETAPSRFIRRPAAAIFHKKTTRQERLRTIRCRFFGSLRHKGRTAAPESAAVFSPLLSERSGSLTFPRPNPSFVRFYPPPAASTISESRSLRRFPPNGSSQTRPGPTPVRPQCYNCEGSSPGNCDKAPSHWNSSCPRRKSPYRTEPQTPANGDCDWTPVGRWYHVP